MLPTLSPHGCNLRDFQFHSQVCPPPLPHLDPISPAIPAYNHKLNLDIFFVSIPSVPWVTLTTDPAAPTAFSLSDIYAMSLSLSLAIALCAALVARQFWVWYRLSHIPGPFSASLSKGWLLRHTLSGRMNLELKKACDQYGESAFLKSESLQSLTS